MIMARVKMLKVKTVKLRIILETLMKVKIEHLNIISSGRWKHESDKSRSITSRNLVIAWFNQNKFTPITLATLA